MFSAQHSQVRQAAAVVVLLLPLVKLLGAALNPKNLGLEPMEKAAALRKAVDGFPARSVRGRSGTRTSPVATSAVRALQTTPTPTPNDLYNIQGQAPGRYGFREHDDTESDNANRGHTGQPPTPKRGTTTDAALQGAFISSRVNDTDVPQTRRGR